MSRARGALEALLGNGPEAPAHGCPRAHGAASGQHLPRACVWGGGVQQQASALSQAPNMAPRPARSVRGHSEDAHHGDPQLLRTEAGALVFLPDVLKAGVRWMHSQVSLTLPHPHIPRQPLRRGGRRWGSWARAVATSFPSWHHDGQLGPLHTNSISSSRETRQPCGTPTARFPGDV